MLDAITSRRTLYEAFARVRSVKHAVHRIDEPEVNQACLLPLAGAYGQPCSWSISAP